jgi:hypothetical protein
MTLPLPPIVSTRAVGGPGAEGGWKALLAAVDGGRRESLLRRVRAREMEAEEPAGELASLRPNHDSSFPHLSSSARARRQCGRGRSRTSSEYVDDAWLLRRLGAPRCLPADLSPASPRPPPPRASGPTSTGRSPSSTTFFRMRSTRSGPSSRARTWISRPKLSSRWSTCVPTRRRWARDASLQADVPPPWSCDCCPPADDAVPSLGAAELCLSCR